MTQDAFPTLASSSPDPGLPKKVWERPLIRLDEFSTQPDLILIQTSCRFLLQPQSRMCQQFFPLSFPPFLSWCACV